MAVRARTLLGLGDNDPALAFADVSYDGKCDDWSFAQIVDIFFFAHLIGYAAMAYSVGSVAAAWVVSVGFEFVELSLKNWMPNFKEVSLQLYMRSRLSPPLSQSTTSVLVGLTDS